MDREGSSEANWPLSDHQALKGEWTFAEVLAARGVEPKSGEYEWTGTEFPRLPDRLRRGRQGTADTWIFSLLTYRKSGCSSPFCSVFSSLFNPSVSTVLAVGGL